MSTHSAFFGLIRRVYCDRCRERIDHSRLSLCEACSGISFEAVRRSELLDDWQQARASYKTCCLCRKQFAEPLKHDVCLRCSQQHPDYSHCSWATVPSTGRTCANHCCVCNSVQVVTKPADDAPAQFRYFRVGSTTASETPFRCLRTDFNETWGAVCTCRHHWLVVASTIHSAVDASSIRSELVVSGIAAIMGFDNVDIDHIALGQTSFWCSKCGNFYQLSPNRYHMLPEYGDDRR